MNKIVYNPEDETRKSLLPEEVDQYFELYDELYRNGSNVHDSKSYFKFQTIISNMKKDYNSLVGRSDLNENQKQLVEGYRSFFTVLDLYDAYYMSTKELKKSICLSARDEKATSILRIQNLKTCLETRKDKNVEINYSDFISNNDLDLFLLLKDKKETVGLSSAEIDLYENFNKFFNSIQSSFNEFKAGKSDYEKEMVTALEPLIRIVYEHDVKFLSTHMLEESLRHLRESHLPCGVLKMEAIEKELNDRKQKGIGK